jgi:two-component system, NtrC family, sensor kinase
VRSSATNDKAKIAQLTQELKEALEQQAATAEVLDIISTSPGDLQRVFDTLLTHARKLCHAGAGNIYRWDGQALHLVATHNTPPAFAEYRGRVPFRPSMTSVIGRMVKTKTVTHVPDARDNPDYIERTDLSLVAAIDLGGVRTYLAVPMLKNDELIGAFTVYREEVRPFSERQIALATSFANQAVIAIENTRLMSELRQMLQQQSTAADVLNLVSHSTFDLQTVLDTLVDSAVRLCGADLAAMHREVDANRRVIATYGGPPTHKELASGVPFEPGRGSVIARAVMERQPVQVVDVLADPEYSLQSEQSKIGYRTVLGVPLLREGIPIGVIVLMRFTVRPFSEAQIALVQNFAAHAVVAIENTRLLHELRERTNELGRSLADLQRERNNKLMDLEAMAASIGHEVRQPLGAIASNGSAARRFLNQTPPHLEETRAALDRIIRDTHRASQVFDNIRALFGKGEREREPIDLKELAQSVLQALVEELQDHKVETRVALSSELPPILGHRGQLQEVLINLVRNAIDAMDSVAEDSRTLRVSARLDGGNAIVVAVEDSGPGIAPQALDSIFEAFITTKPHGMGLGLALCRMIIERHDGELSAAPANPRGAVFRIVLPATPEDAAARAPSAS